MRALLLIFSTLFLMAADRPKRIISTSLCADHYVLSSAPHDHIAALSWQSEDPVSSAPGGLENPKAWDDIERLLSLQPDLVVFGPGEGQHAKPLLQAMGIDYITINWGEDFKAVQDNQRILGQALGQSTPLSSFDTLDTRHTVSVLYLSRAGGSAGPGTYVDAAITMAGGTNIITTAGWHTPELETLLSLKPDLIITSFFESGYASINENGLRHKVLQNKLKTTPHINIPGKLWPCAGPGLQTASDMIQKKIKKMIP